MLFSLPLRCKLTSGVVTKWYRNRACEMESLSKQVLIYYVVSFSGFKIGNFHHSEEIVSQISRTLESELYAKGSSLHTTFYGIYPCYYIYNVQIVLAFFVTLFSATACPFF